jgi:hypothetical protein
MTDAEIEERINEFFDANYEMLKLEGGHSMTRDTLESARQQVLMYWRKLRDVAASVTETEVKLTLPGQTTPDGRRFGIEGVVDIVREAGRTVMYDLKTHAAEQIRGNREAYAQQLNVYAHIWQELRAQDLDEQCVICTQLPRELREALSKPEVDERQVQHLLDRWEPLIDIPADSNTVHETVRKFGAVVDRIERGDYAPPPVSVLQAPAPGGRLAFARDICRNCDARFSCSAYRAHIAGGNRAGQFDKQFRQYLEDYGDDEERVMRRVAATLQDDGE